MARAGEELFNPLTGERIVFVRSASETGGELLELDDHWTRPGHRAPEHVHPQMRERWEVRAGVAGFRIDGAERTAGPGELVVADPGVPHLAWNAGGQPVHLRIQLRPALGWEDFVVELFALADEAHRRGLEDPEPRALLELLARFPREVAPAPAPGAGARSRPSR
jgi:quercetin dioxygenase-like cupin family protein